MRTSMCLRLSGSLLLLPLAATVQRAVGVVAHRYVEDHRDDAEHDAGRHVLLHDRDEDREDHGSEGGTVDRAAPSRRLVELVLALLTGRRLLLGLAQRPRAGGLPGAPGPLDSAGLGTAVLTPALLPGLGHGGLLSLTLPRCSARRSPRAPRAPLSEQGRRARSRPPARAAGSARLSLSAASGGSRARSWRPAPDRAP